MKINYNLDKYECIIELQTSKMANRQLKEIANKALRGSLVVQWGLDEIPYINGRVEWNIQLSSVSNSIQVRLQSLSILLFLCAAYREYKSIEYLKLAINIFEDWYEYVNSEKAQKNVFLWNDHAVAERTESLIFFLLCCKKENQLNEELQYRLENILLRQGEWLNDDKNYFYNCNHGIFEDRALICLSMLISNEQSGKWLAKAKQRVAEQRKFAFTDEMVHVENSPQYQETVLRLFCSIAEFLSEFDDLDGIKLYDDVKRSLEFLMWTIKPTGYMAEIGDSDGSLSCSPIVNRRFERFGNNFLNYAATLGRGGVKPQNCYAIYPQSGYFFSRSNWEKENFTDATWLMFKAGYHSRVHKHGDDLSLMLASKGYDILIDPGKYGYTIGEPHVDYLHSALAHNTVVVDEKSYSISDERTHLAGILEYNLNVKENEYLYVRAFNNSYYGVYIDRAIYHKDEIIFVHDEILSKDNHVYSQMFHLSEYVKVLKESKDEIVGQIGDSGYIIRITQLSGVDDVHIYQGMQPDAKYGYRSPVMKEIVNCTTVRFEKYGSKTEFVTMIAIEPLENISKNIGFFKNKNKIYNCNHISNITLNRRPRPDLSLITCRVDNKIDSIILEADLLEDMSQYVWEVVDVRKNLILESQTTINSNCKFFASFCTDICIKVTFITNTNQKLKGIVAYLKYNHRSGYEVLKETEKPLNLQMNGMQMEWLTKETLRCTVLFDYAFDCGLNWHIYRNGGHYFYKYEKNNPTFEYQFTEPGAYTVMFYICGLAGEKDFWNFPQFNIIGKGEICGEQKL